VISYAFQVCVLLLGAQGGSGRYACSRIMPRKA